jgi:polysaccharide export outer membrane protein
MFHQIGFALFALALWIPARGSAQNIQPPKNVAVPTNYLLGPDDQLSLMVTDLEELEDKVFRIDQRGDVNIPLAGRIHCEGLTVEQVESEIDKRLKKLLKEPHSVVSVTEFRSQPVSLLGAVGAPGVHQLEGRKTLVEILSLAGGLRADSGNIVKITRDLKWGPIPLPNAQNDPSGRYSVASVSAKSIMNGTNPVENILIKPQDSITVPKADLVYVIGSVNKPGGFVLNQQDSVSALQLLSMAEGLGRNAAGGRARIIRLVPGNPNRVEIPVDLKKLLAGKAPDLQLHSEDILFVPNNPAKSALNRTAEAAISVGTGLAIYARP